MTILILLVSSPALVAAMEGAAACQDPLMIRRFAYARILYGAALLAGARRVLDVTGYASAGGRAVAVVRLLGVRHLVQGLFLARRGSRRAIRRGMEIDALHGTSMIALSFISLPYRPLAGLDAVAAAGWIVAGARAAA